MSCQRSPRTTVASMTADQQAGGAAGDGLEVVAAAIVAALRADDRAGLADLLDPSVTWGDCAGASAVLEFVAAVAAQTAPVDVDVRAAPSADRLVAAFRIGDDGPTMTQAVFVRAGRIVEIIDVADRETACTVRPIGDLAGAAARPWRVERSSPVLLVGDLRRAADHYRALGFDVRAYEGAAAYAFASRDEIELHLAEAVDIDPGTNTSALYLYVDDADALYASWRLADVDGRLIAPADTEYGLREGAHVDIDGNLIRFGSPT